MANIAKWMLDLIGNPKTAKFVETLKHSDLPKNWANDPEIVGLAERAYQQGGTESPFFKAYFQGSKAVDENGKPLVLYHGTENGGFSQFSKDFLGDTTNAPSAKQAFFATNSPDNANYYTLSNIFPSNEAWKGFLDSLNQKTLDLGKDAGDINRFLDKLTSTYRPEFDNVNLNNKGISWNDLFSEEVRELAPTTYKYSWANAPKIDDFFRYSAENGGEKNIDDLKAAYDEFKQMGGSKGLQDLFSNTDVDFSDISKVMDRYKKGISSYDKDYMDFISYRDKLNKHTGTGFNPDEVSLVEKTGNPSVYPIYLKENKPLSHDYKGDTWRDESFNDLLTEAKAKGNDSAIFKNVFDPFFGNMHAVFEPNQIKSIFNRGTFNPLDPDIMKSVAPVGVGLGTLAAAGMLPDSEASAKSAYINSPEMKAAMMGIRDEPVKDAWNPVEALATAPIGAFTTGARAASVGIDALLSALLGD